MSKHFASAEFLSLSFALSLLHDLVGCTNIFVHVQHNSFIHSRRSFFSSLLPHAVVMPESSFEFEHLGFLHSVVVTLVVMELCLPVLSQLSH